jgi:hypothetical protein
MRNRGMEGLGRSVIAAAGLAVAAGCAMPVPDVLEGTTIVKSVERRGWDREEEPGLFRIEFDAKRMQAIRREAGTAQAPEGADPHDTEQQAVEREASRELRAKGLCSGDAVRVSALHEGDGKSGASAIFKCRPTLF